MRKRKVESTAPSKAALMVEAATAETARVLLPVLVQKAEPLPRHEDLMDRNEAINRIVRDAWDLADAFLDMTVRRGGPGMPRPHEVD